MPSSFLARQLAPLPPEARLDLAQQRLRDGFYRDGWALHEARRDIPYHPEHLLPIDVPAWQGTEDLADRTLVLWYEQGLGDMIQMLRFVPILARRGARIVLVVQPALRRLAACLADVVQVTSSWDIGCTADFQCPLLSLPYLLGIHLATLPARVPYLRPPAALTAAWRDRLGAKSVPRVGIVWSGNASNLLDRWRSIAAMQLAPLFDLPGVEFHLLQNDIRAPDQAALQLFPNLREHDSDLADLADAAALAANMDLVVTVCTAMAHLAGALGLPTWVLLSTRAYCLWLSGRDDSPWYPSLRLFRQPAPDEWQPVIDRVVSELRRDLLPATA